MKDADKNIRHHEERRLNKSSDNFYAPSQRISDDMNDKILN